MTTKIEWVRSSNGEKGETWNPLAGCSRKSTGCQNCYAEKMTKRLKAMGVEKYQGLLNEHGRFNGNVRFDKNALMIPLKRKKPTTYFVNSMSDLFHENVPDDWIDQMLAVMTLTPQHTYQCLTKRADRMQEYLADPYTRERIVDAIYLVTPRSKVVATFFDLYNRRVVHKIDPHTDREIECLNVWPLKNVWMGVSVEDQKTADERIPLLLQTPAAIRFLSVEPLLEYTRIKNEWLSDRGGVPGTMGQWVKKPDIDWAIIGGESGPNARPFDLDWIRPLIRQCKAANVPVFVKQLGGHVLCRNDNGFEGEHDQAWPDGTAYQDNPSGYREDYQGAPVRVRLKDKKGGDMSEWPLDLRIREMPQRFAS